MKTHPRNSKRHGFSTVVALLMMAFITALTLGVLSITLREGRINQTFYRSILATAGAESALEYAQLKIKNHSEGFEDTIAKTNRESGILATIPSTPIYGQEVTITYDMERSGTDFSGSIAPGGSLIVPLFFDAGTIIGGNAKHPNAGTSNVEQTHTFELSVAGTIVWNILGNDTTTSITHGLSGSGVSGSRIGNTSTATQTTGWRKDLNTTTGDFTLDTAASIGGFLTSHTQAYLVVRNPTETEVPYVLTADNGFSFPLSHIRAAAQIGEVRTNLELTEDRSRVLEPLKYSVFTR